MTEWRTIVVKQHHPRIKATPSLPFTNYMGLSEHRPLQNLTGHQSDAISSVLSVKPMFGRWNPHKSPMFESKFKCFDASQSPWPFLYFRLPNLVTSPIFPRKTSPTRMVSDDEGAHAAPKRLARAKRADSPVSTVSTAISTAAATVSAVASTATASNTGSEGLWVGGGGWVGAVGAGGWDDGQSFSGVFWEVTMLGWLRLRLNNCFRSFYCLSMFGCDIFWDEGNER